jgi:hypothetical protein
MKDVSVELPLPSGFSSPGEFPPPGDFGGLPPSGEFQPSDNQGMIFIKTGAFEILADD